MLAGKTRGRGTPFEIHDREPAALVQQRERRHLPNLVAVNFYRRGDVFRVVDTLNGVR